MKDKFFLDTNIFIYSFDYNYPEKRNIARKLIKSGIEENNSVISYQVVQEFLNVATRKFDKPLTPADAKLYLNAVLMPMCVVYPSTELFQYAIDVSDRFRFSFYDSLIIASALDASADILYSEDLQHNQEVHSLKIVNPFLEKQSA